MAAFETPAPPENLPDAPGVYLFRNSRDRIVYVGKARSLKKRVSSYFHKTIEDVKTRALLSEYRSLETIVTRTELEALLLENALIKKHHPRYNVCLRDDKTYPYIKITTGEEWPRALVTRRVLDDGHSYFGPFWGGLVRRTMKMITRHFQIRTCSIEIDGRLPRPCLYYDLHACLAPCVAGLTTKEAYDEAVRDVILFLQGKNTELSRSLEKKMEEAAASENFEMAAAYRDALRTVEELAERQVVQRLSGEDADTWGIHEDGGDAAIQVLVARGGTILDRRELFFEKVEGTAPEELLSTVIAQFYDQTTFLPDEVQVPFDLPDRELLEEFLTAKKGSRVVVRRPQRGPAKDRLEMAMVNAKARHHVRFRRSKTAEEDAVARLSRLLGLPEPARRIEGFDISHIQGTTSYASMVVFEGGRPKKSDYRLFKIHAQDLLAPDDFASMAEAVSRRYSRVAAEGGALPDLVLVDGGRGQLSAAITALDRIGVEVPVVGLAKKEEELYVPGRPDPIRLARHESALRLVQRVRDEAHRFAIGRHRRTRRSVALTTSLRGVPGVGPIKAKKLLRRFGSVGGVRQAPREEIASVVGPRAAENVIEHLRGQ
ncbi:MAG TPA: excinuclease ABC subunit UvrC [Thermoanaerobaculia bacterium]|nr:excinuclease ABC subunit UvrC [Thermoanaerobaculia bacterium]